MIFAWQGFVLEHPEDWAPVVLSGNRKEGYVRIASPGNQSLQIRWRAAGGSADLAAILSSYFDRLSRDARAAKVDFRSESDAEDGRLVYRYASAQCGRGVILQSEASSRLFFLEAVSTKSDSLLRVYRRLAESFHPDPETERWALFGLDLRVPGVVSVERKVLQSGRTQLTLTCKHARIEAQRWGFAEQLIAKHGLEAWVRSMLEMPKGVLSSTADGGLELTEARGPLRPPLYAMAQVQPDRNQIATVKVTTRSQEWRPTWDWFA